MVAGKKAVSLMNYKIKNAKGNVNIVPLRIFYFRSSYNNFNLIR